MKKTFTAWLAVAAIVLIPVIAGCEKENGKNEDQESLLTFENTVVEVMSDGGDFKMKYFIENPLEGLVPAASSAAEWITSCTAGNGEIAFTVARNDSEESRKADIDVEYDGKSYSFEVSQQGVGGGADEPEINFDSEKIQAASEGGEYYVEYTITNPVSDAEIEVYSDAAWIGQFDTSAYGRISFSVQENTGESRSADVEVKYAGIEKVFTVVQDAGSATGGKTIDIVIVDASTLNIIVSIIPSDKEMGYIAMAAEKSFIDSFSSDEALFEDEMNYYEEQAVAWGVDLATYLQYVVLFRGDNPEMPMSIMSYDVPYYVYAYGVNEEDVTLETKVFKKELTVSSN